MTEDVDLVLDCDVDEAIALLNSLDPDLFVPFVADAESTVRRCFILPLEDSRSKVKADLAIGISGFEKMIVDRATSVELGEDSILIATAEDLLLMKVLAGRPQDDQDIKGLLAVNGTNLDWQYCVEVATQLQAALGVDVAAKVSLLKEKM